MSGTAAVSQPTVPTSTVTGLVVGTATLRWTSTAATCPARTDDVVVTRLATPSLAISAPLLLHQCPPSNGQVTLTTGALAPELLVSWLRDEGSAGTALANATPTSVVATGLGAGQTITVRVRAATNDACINVTSAAVVVRVAPTLSAGADADLGCASTYALLPSEVVEGTGSWQVVSGGVGMTLAGNTVANVPAGATTLRYSVTGASSCGATTLSDDVVLTRLGAALNAVDAGPDQASCGAFQLAASALQAGATGLWSVDTGIGGVFSDPALPNAVFTPSLVGVSVLRWTVSYPGCASVSDTVTVTATAAVSAAVAGSNIFLGCGVTATLGANTPLAGVGAWSVISGGATIAQPLLPASTVTLPSTTATSTLRWSITLLACTPSTDDVTLTRLVNGVTPAVAGPVSPVDIGCASTYVLGANAPASGETGTWTTTRGTLDSATSNVTTLRGITDTPTTVTWTISASQCTPSSSSLVLTSYASVTPANAGPDQFLGCADFTTLAANAPVNGTGTWTLVSGSATIVNAASPTTTVTGVALGGAVLRWTVSGPNCTASTDDVALTRIASLAVPDLGADMHLACASSATLSLTGAPAHGTASWSVVSGSATLVGANATWVNVTALNGAQAIVRYTVSLASCPSVQDDVILTRYANGVSAASVGPSSSVDIGCATGVSALSAVPPSIGTGEWSVDSGTATIIDASDPTSAVSGLTGSVVLRWTVSLATCPSKSAVLAIKRYDNVSPAVIGHGDLNVGCLTSTRLNATQPVDGFGTWTRVNGTGTVWDATSSTTRITSLTSPLATFRYTVSAPSCVPSVATVVVHQANITAPECAACSLVGLSGTDVVTTCDPPTPVIISSLVTLGTPLVFESLAVASTGHFIVTSGVSVTMQALLSVGQGGNMTLSGTGAAVIVQTLTAGSNSLVNVANGGALTVQGDLTSSGASFVISNGTFTVAGSISFDAATQITLDSLNGGTGLTAGQRIALAGQLFLKLAAAFFPQQQQRHSVARADTVTTIQVASCGTGCTGSFSSVTPVTSSACDRVSSVTPAYSGGGMSVTVNIGRDAAQPGCAVDSGLSAGAIAGIVIAVVAVTAGAVALAVVLVHRKRGRDMEALFMQRERSRTDNEKSLSSYNVRSSTTMQPVEM